MKYLREFETQAAYNAAESTLILPNVSYIEDTNSVAYKPYIPIPQETRVVAKFNVTSTSEPTPVNDAYGTSGFSEIEIDGVVQPTVESAYTFSTLGEHTVKYTLKDQTLIANFAFERCGNLINITIPNSVTSIGVNAFQDCSGLTSCPIGSGITTIDMAAFQGCTSFTSITIPSSVTSIDFNSFGGCVIQTNNFINNSQLDEVANDYWGAILYDEKVNGMYIKGTTVIKSDVNITEANIPNNITRIDGSVFSYRSGLTSCTIGNSITSIGAYAFYGSTSLTSITVEATTPPTLESSVFENTNDCPIYVPSGSVDAYKAASSWSEYASRIQAIS